MIRISHFEARSFVDGPGERAVLFVQGCPIECPGCQNKHLWPDAGGRLEDERDIAFTLANLAKSHGNITISGGEPFAQPEALRRLLVELRDRPEVKHIIVYTGFRFEALQFTTLGLVDIVVDGMFIRGQDDPMISYRGSRNQRPIDVQASFEQGRTVVMDWDNPEIVISNEGNALLPVGLAPEFHELGIIQNTRRCGQTKGA